MTDRYVRSGNGAPLSPFTSWADAAQTLAAALAVASNADTIWVSEDHNESTAGSVTYALPATPGLRVICAANHVTAPPTAVGTTATVGFTGSGVIATFGAGCAYFYGISFTNAGTATSTFSLGAATSTGTVLVFDACKFVLTAGTGRVDVGTTNSGPGYVHLRNCQIGLAVAAHLITLRNGIIRMEGLTLAGAGTSTNLFSVTAHNSTLIEASDLTGRAIAGLFTLAGNFSSRITMRDCVLPSLTAIVSSPPLLPASGKLTLHNCDNADTHINVEEVGYSGTAREDTTKFVTGGAEQSDGTDYSWLLVPSNASYALPLQSPELAVWNNTVGTPITVTVEVLSGVTLTSADAWLEVIYCDLSGAPRGAVATTRPSTPIASGSAYATSTAAWNSAGTKQKMAVPFTPAEAGFLLVRACVASANTINVNPVATVT